MGNLKRANLRTALTGQIINLAAFLDGNCKSGGKNLFINPEAGAFTYGASLEQMKPGDIFLSTVSRGNGIEGVIFEASSQQLVEYPEGMAALAQIGIWLDKTQATRRVREATFTPALGRKTFGGFAITRGAEYGAQFINRGGKFASRVRLHETNSGGLALGITVGEKYYGQAITKFATLSEANWHEMFVAPAGRTIAGISQSGNNVMAFNYRGAYQLADLNDVVASSQKAATAMTPVLKSKYGVINAEKRGQETFLRLAKYGSPQGATSMLRINSNRLHQSAKQMVLIEASRGSGIPTY